MKLSVVMAVRNGEPYLADAIESVLAQSFTDFEFLVVDDGSTDGSPRILSDYERQDSRIRVLRHESPLGPYPSANRALVLARGRFIARHDADDISPRDRFAIQLDALDSDPEISLVTGAVELFGHSTDQAHAVSRPPSSQPRLEWELLFTNAVGAGGHVMFPRVVRGTPVRFPAQYRYAEDYGLWCRLSRLGRVVCPPQVVYRYRQHESSITSRQKAEQRDCLAQMRAAYQRQYLQSHVPAETLDEVSRFWTADGRRPSPGSLRTITSIVLELRSNVLSYVDQRYGSAARADLEAEIDANLEDRLGYWLFRSMRSLDGHACMDLLALAMARQQTVTVVRAALDRAGNAFRRKLAGH